MDTIASFEVDHTKLKPGMYISRVDGDVVTYDLRFVVPNGGYYLPCPVMHTIEHLFAVRMRNGKYGKNIVYFGPMGCRTGFYLLTTGLSHAEAVALVKQTAKEMSVYEDAVPGTSAKECGNYLEHDLDGAKKFCAEYAETLTDWTADKLYYEK